MSFNFQNRLDNILDFLFTVALVQEQLERTVPSADSVGGHEPAFAGGEGADQRVDSKIGKIENCGQ